MNSLKHQKKCHENSKQSQMKKIKQFDFLMQSLQREKFPNHLKENSKDINMRHSIKGHMTNSIMVTPTLQTKQMDVSPLVQTLIYKIKSYLSITKSIFDNSSTLQQKTKMQGISIGFEIMQLISQIQQDYSLLKLQQQSPYNSLNATVNVMSGITKSLSSSLCSPNNLTSSFTNGKEESNTFIKKIYNLEEEKMYLESLISHHQRANIKMFIKLNEGESQTIQQCKKQLSSLFQKYKQLQKLVKRQSQKSKLLQIQLNQSLSTNICKKHCQQTKIQLKSQITNLQQIINDQNDSLSFAVDQLEIFKHKLSKYQNQNISPIVPTQQCKKYQKNKQHSRVSEFPGTELIKSVMCQNMIETANNKSFSKCTNNTLIDSLPSFNNISIKSNLQTKIDDNLMRMMMTQASLLQTFLKK